MDAGTDAGTPDFSQLPHFQDLFPWTPAEYVSSNADTWHLGVRFCYEPATKAVWMWSFTKGCDANHDEDYPLELGFKAFLRAHANRHVSISLNVVFPDGTFTDRRLDGTQVTYVSTWDLKTDSAFHAYNLHDPRTKTLFNEAYAAVIHAFDGIGNIIGWQIGYNVYQENLVGTFGFSAEALSRFKTAWSGELAAQSKLGSTDLAAVSALVGALDPANLATWPLPVTVADHAHYTDTPDNRAHRFYYAYFQKFRQRDLAALQKSLFDTVKATAGPTAWVEMYNSQLYIKQSLPSPMTGPGYIQFGELPMLPVLDPAAPTLYSLGQDEGMYLHGYQRPRCATTWCQATPGHDPLYPYGVCASTRGDPCVCETIANSCLDDWRLDRTIAYVLRDRAHGIRHRVDDNYVHSGYSVSGSDWTYDDSVRLGDFKTLDNLVFNGYGTVGGSSFENLIDDSAPVQVRLYYPVWVLGAVPRLFGPTPYATGYGDSDFFVNLLESRGVKFQPINEDWTHLSTPVVVPFADLIAPLLAEIPGYDPTKVIPQNTIPIASPSPVDSAYADSVMAAIAAKVPGLAAPIIFNPLEKTDPANGYEMYWVMRVGAYNNVVYNLSTTAHCIGLSGNRSLRVSPFETRIISPTVDDKCR
jgi:hypothetical protein